MEVGKVVHSQSQPGGIDRTPPGTPKKGGKMLAVRVQMLDDTITMFQVQAKALGRVLFDQVCNQLHLLESDYFGLEYQEMGGTKYWLDLEKPLSRQIGLSLIDTLVWFCVKFYTPDPSQLEEEFTRYLFCLQIKRDLSQGLLQCNSNTAALMASYIVQAECGDYVVEDYPDHKYLSSYKFVPNQDQETEKRIMENHKKHAGQSPAEADLNLLETARRCELYGIKMHPAKDHEGVPLNLAVAHMGIVVFQNFSKINTFSWAKIRKISFKRKRFLVKLHPEGYGYYKDTVEFFFEGRNECKNFWKKCVENHGFFRCSIVKKVPRQKTRVLSRGSSFRYSGRTQKQIVDFVRENYVKRQAFQRSQSFRHSSSAHSSVANVGTSISAHPLLPLGENAVAGTPASLSCGSMTLTSSPLHAANMKVGELPSPALIASGSAATSITSSPQHFYPQETPYPRTGHQSAKVKHPHERSHHGIPSLQSPTNAATAVNNHSANLSNNSISINSNDSIVDEGEAKISPKRLNGLDYANFNDVYSNCYSSLRSLQNNADIAEINCDKMKTDICRITTSHFLNGTSKSNESIKGSKSAISNKAHREDGFAWNRSASYKDLYHEKNAIKDNENIARTSKTGLNDEVTCNFDSLANLGNRNGTKSYSAGSGTNSSGDRRNNFLNETKIYSSSYPGTVSSLSTESGEDEAEVPHPEVLDFKYDSQEELVLSHDDVSHDSYELLEKELNDFDDGIINGNKRKRIVGETDRARSCSWGSDRGGSPLNFVSSENAIGASLSSSRENGFWSLERERCAKNKSVTDFRSLDRKRSKASRRNEGQKSMVPAVKRGREKDLTQFGESAIAGNESEDEKKARDDFSEDSNNFSTAEEYLSFLDRESWMWRQGKNLERENDMGIVERSTYVVRGKNSEKSEAFLMRRETEEKFMKERQYRMEERKRVERKRDKKEKRERFHEGIKEKEQREWEKEKERRLLERKKNMEEKKMQVEPGSARKLFSGARDFPDFKEIHFKKFDRVVSNQFGKYSEFLTEENNYDLLVQMERKVIEKYEKVCQVGKLVREMEKKEKQICLADTNSGFSENFPINDKLENEKESKDLIEPVRCHHFYNEKEKAIKGDVERTSASSESISTFSKEVVKRTKSDPYNERGENLKRNVLIHQKSLDNTPSFSEEIIIDQEQGEGWWKKTSRSELDIPYVLHKRHYHNNAVPKTTDFTVLKTDIKVFVECEERESQPSQAECKVATICSPKEKESFPEEVRENSDLTEIKSVEEPTKTEIETLNFDSGDDKTSGSVRNLMENWDKLHSKPPVGKKTTLAAENKRDPKSFSAKSKYDFNGDHKIEESLYKSTESLFTACADKKKMTNKREIEVTGNISGEATKQTTSLQQEANLEDKETNFDGNKKTSVNPLTQSSAAFELTKDVSLKASSKGIFIEKRKACILPKKNLDAFKLKIPNQSSEETGKEECVKSQPQLLIRGMQGLIGAVHRRREESLILFARTRLGLSEGSAFAPLHHKQCPTSQRRTKSLDAPYVSVHRLPPVDSFSSKDDTLDGNEGDVVTSAADRTAEIFKNESKSTSTEAKPILNGNLNLKKKETSFFAGNVKIESNIRKKWSTSQTELHESRPVEEKLFDGSRSQKMSSKLESVDGIDSEGDMDSSKLTDAPSIPSDRLVNLPESVRFPSVRQISGQTSEESADGWDQKDVKVKRRTPRRSVGRDESEAGLKESVVWDSKDDEMPEDEVWDDNLVFSKRYDGSVSIDSVIPVEYLKRGSCGQSIDDDNLSTPMKESSPEHWVSVDDLPEAIEREEKLLRLQEKILREKIMSEKLKRELNLDTIDVDQKFYDCKADSSQASEIELVEDAGKFKGHSLDTYELTEKKMREKESSKCYSLDEHMLREKDIQNYANFSMSDVGDMSEAFTPFLHRRNVDYLECKIVSDLREIDRFVSDNDEELEEFFVVLDENADGNKKKNPCFLESVDIFGDEEGKRSLSKEDSVISVPEGFRDEDEEKILGADSWNEDEFRSNESQAKNETENEEISNSKEKQIVLSLADDGAAENGEKGILQKHSDDLSSNSKSFPCEGSRRNSEDQRHFSLVTDGGSLSPYENSSGKNWCGPKRFSVSDEASDRLSPFNDSRRLSEESRRFSNSEDSKKYSMSESVSDETRRRLSSTEETRRKRASLTKQCSVGADSLSDEIVSGIQECSSSFEQDDEKDVFEAEPGIAKPAKPIESSASKVSETIHREVERNAEEKMAKANDENVCQKLSELKLNSAPKDAICKKIANSEISLMTEAVDTSHHYENLEHVRNLARENVLLGSELLNESIESFSENSNLPNLLNEIKSSDENESSFVDEKIRNVTVFASDKSGENATTKIGLITQVEADELVGKNGSSNESGRKTRYSFPFDSKPADCEIENGKFSESNEEGAPSQAAKKKHLKFAKLSPRPKIGSGSFTSDRKRFDSANSNSKSSFDSSQDSDIDRLEELSTISHVQNQIARRNLADAGKSLRCEDFKWNQMNGEGISRKTSSEEIESSSSFEGKVIADEFACYQNEKRISERKLALKCRSETEKNKLSAAARKEKENLDQEKRDSGEDGSSSSSAPLHRKRELSSTWKPFLLESSGSSSLEENWLPPDDNAHLADEEETTSTSNNQQDECGPDDIDYPAIAPGYPVLNMSGAEMIVGGYGGVYSLSRTLSRISERSTSEQERSDLEDDLTKPSSHSISIEEESVMSSDRQPSLSSDSPSLRGSAARIPDLPDDRCFVSENLTVEIEKLEIENRKICEPFGGVIPPPLQDDGDDADDCPSPASNSSVFAAVGVSHIETVYLEIYPEEARKVIVVEPQHDEGHSSSDENQTLHEEEEEFLHLSSDNVTITSTTTATTQDGTVVVPFRRRSVRTASVSEDTSLASISDWSNSTSAKPRTNLNFAVSEDFSDRSKCSTVKSSGRKINHPHANEESSDLLTPSPSRSGTDETGIRRSEVQGARGIEMSFIPLKQDADAQETKTIANAKPPKLISPTGKLMGFFETPASKVRSPTSQGKFFETEDDRGNGGSSILMSPTSRSESSSPKDCKRFSHSLVRRKVSNFFQVRNVVWPERRENGNDEKENLAEKGCVAGCIPHYSNAADSAENSFFGRCDTGSLERTKIMNSRKSCSHYSVSKTIRDQEDSSDAEDSRMAVSNTIPRASKKTKKRHRVAMDLEIRDGRIVSMPKTQSTVIENTDSDKSSPRKKEKKESNL